MQITTSFYLNRGMLKAEKWAAKEQPALVILFIFLPVFS